MSINLNCFLNNILYITFNVKENNWHNKYSSKFVLGFL